MDSGQVVVSQWMELLPRHEFDTSVRRDDREYEVRAFSCRDRSLCMAYAQLAYRESLRDIEPCLLTDRPKLHHAGFRGRIARSTLADANRERDWRIDTDFAQDLIGRARVFHATDNFGLTLEQTAYALDSPTIGLCLTLFARAPFRRHKAAVKLHPMIDLPGNIPTFVHVSSGKRHEVTILDELPIEAGAFSVMDRGFLDFGRLNRPHRQSAYFITRARRNLDASRRGSREVNRTTGLRCDQRLICRGRWPRKKSPESLRRISDDDPERGKRLIFLTNNFE